ncbi:hypothetical protein S7711_09798 [Stachybotrys chartarum IBT 7711]|uniref:Peptidase S8/S53 domain-containing protein n=1 Tax=Stachybotrys chartarum (strain CBS 109288 / IBT 7711) TaxID=1280523 RepID=A0A084B9Y3_STACB|nr:hypothetical protein S7711_09798 [Stachybotrys chartarum IBT 7711]
MDVHKGIGPQASKVFKECYHEAFTDRVLKLFPLGRPSTGESSDPSGHGTHVYGLVLGVGNHESKGVVESPASEATLIVQSLFDRFYNTESPDPRL